MTTATDAARALVAQRVRVEHTCSQCGKAFTGYRNARTCSNACRQAATHKRKRQRKGSPPGAEV